MFIAVHASKREEWIHQAKCKGMDINLFFPDPTAGNHHPEAIAACKACPVIEQCADWAIKHESHGYQGGMTPNQRHKERVFRRIALWSPQQNLTTPAGGLR